MLSSLVLAWITLAMTAVDELNSSRIYNFTRLAYGQCMVDAKNWKLYRRISMPTVVAVGDYYVECTAVCACNPGRVELHPQSIHIVREERISEISLAEIHGQRLIKLHPIGGHFVLRGRQIEHVHGESVDEYSIADLGSPQLITEHANYRRYEVYVMDVYPAYNLFTEEWMVPWTPVVQHLNAETATYLEFDELQAIKINGMTLSANGVQQGCSLYGPLVMKSFIVLQGKDILLFQRSPLILILVYFTELDLVRIHVTLTSMNVTAANRFHLSAKGVEPLLEVEISSVGGFTVRSASVPGTNARALVKIPGTHAPVVAAPYCAKELYVTDGRALVINDNTAMPNYRPLSPK